MLKKLLTLFKTKTTGPKPRKEINPHQDDWLKAIDETMLAEMSGDSERIAVAREKEKALLNKLLAYEDLISRRFMAECRGHS